VILPATETTAACVIAEELRAAIAACPIPDDRAAIGITASVGVATFPDHAGNAEDLFRAADAAMFAVKRGAKNGVAAAQEGR
jgi:diguanylate cyclase (GGDEF)-like protein